MKAFDKDGNLVAESNDSGVTWTRRASGEIASIIMDGSTAGVMGSLLHRDSTGRCATCRWAEADDSPGSGDVWTMICKRISRTQSWSGERYEPPAGALAITDENDGGYARLFVSPDFGCVMWEAKPDV